MHLTGDVGKDQYQSAVKAHQPELVAFATRTSIFPFVQKYAGWTKEIDDIPTIAGSYHPTLEPQETVDTPGIDIICVGEGERPLVELADALEAGRPIEGIQNLWIKRNGEVIKNPIRPLIEDLDTLPLPDFELFDFPNLSSSRMKTAVVMLSRGCPFSCTYCCNHQLKEIYPNKAKYSRFYSPQKSIDYLKTIKENYSFVKYINFMDNVLPMRKDWFFEFIEMYRKEISLPFSCRFRTSLMDRDVVKALKDAGCYLVHFGVESGDDYIRNEILDRKVPREQIVAAFDACRELGISALSYNMINLPFEDMSRILSTVKLNAELKPNRMVVTPFYPYPNTRLYNIALENGFIEPHFDYTEDIVIKQPTLTLSQVLFVQRYFRSFVRAYQRARLLPAAIGKPLESFLGWFFVTTAKPHRLMVALANVRLKAVVGAKRLLMRRMPGLYLWLRDRVVRADKGRQLPQE